MNGLGLNYDQEVQAKVMGGIQGPNKVCSQRWARLENFPFPDFFPVEISILVHPNKFQWFQKVTRKKRRSSPHFHTFPLTSFPPSLLQFPFFSSPFSFFSLSLFSLSSFFPSPFPFSSFPLPSKISPKLSKPRARVGDSPTSPTHSYTASTAIEIRLD